MLRGELKLDGVYERLKQTARERLKIEADAACERAKAAAPVQTGRLRESISVREDGECFYVGTDCEYAAAVEFGTSRRAARPFLMRR